MPVDFDAYLRALAATPLDDKTEHSDRSALEKMLQDAADDAEPGAHVQHEPRRDKAGKGSPDFKVTRGGRIAGYVEAKTIDENLSKILRTDQIKKYLTLSDNIILTDYLEFVWLRKDQPPERARLAHSEDLSGRLRLSPESVESVRRLLRGFFSATPERIGKSDVLAVALARRAALLRDFLADELQRQAKEHREGRLHGLYDVFRRQVFHELTVGEFANAFAQMLAYGLFLARLNAGATVMVSLTNVRQHIPGSFGLIRELVRFLEEMGEPEYREIRWVTDEILSIVNGIDLAAIHESLSFRARKAISRKVRAKDEEEHRLFEKDPFVYFYEDFLKAYDPAMRKGRGVYYTPPPVVNFIVRAVDDILKDKFDIRDGLADHRQVTVLDFAAGTGTFLLEVFERIFDNIGGPDAGRADQIVREHMLKNLFGFEYLIAPYTIAHLKLSQYLKDRGHELHADERLQVFLTNTLEPIEPQASMFLPELSHEVEAAQRVKDQPILVILGNPPYSGHSKNKGAWISRAILAYRKGFHDDSGPAQGKWLQDDYVKFIRFAQMKMDESTEGVVGIITNHSWLDGQTFIGMRKSLMDTFDQLYVLDLHGNTKRKERTPDGAKDDNVFDIEQGVAISIFIKKPGIERGVWHADAWGKRLTKYNLTATAQLSDVRWEKLTPESPDWLLKPHDAEAAKAYRELWSLPMIFSPLGDPAPGIVTTHDQFAISFTKTEAKEKVDLLINTQHEAEARRHFRLCTQEQWNYSRAKIELATIDVERATTEILYRPFDKRWTVWDRNVAVHRRERVMHHMMDRNLALVVSKVVKGEPFRHVQIVDVPTEAICMSPLTSNNGFVFPIMTNGSETFSPEFRSFIDDRFCHHYAPDEILGYLYAALYAQAYRQRYSELLKLGFPRLPFPKSRSDFDALSTLGWELAQAHLLKKVPLPSAGRLAEYHGKGDHTVEQVRYSPEEQAIWINKTQSFSPVPQDVWDFYIGGYQVLDKYLKSRKGRTLSLDEQTHIRDVAETLAFTIAQMARIDEVYRAAFPDGDNSTAPLA